MPWWGWVLIAAAAAIVIGVVLWQAMARRRTGRLREQFGPEYDRAVGSAESQKVAEAELQAREEHRERLTIKPLPEPARARYAEEWQAVQTRFVDDPQDAVAQADRLIESVMSDRGYPVEGFEQQAADISVDHPEVVENYRRGHRLAQTTEGDDATEDLRQAMRHFRALFDELVGSANGAGVSSDRPTIKERSAP
jgi:hypothetical protein